MKFLIVYTFGVRAGGDCLLSAPDLHAEGQRLMDALLDLEECNDHVSDAATSTDAAEGVVVVELLIGADTVQDAVEKFLAVVRTAIHSIGGVTADWPAPAMMKNAAEYAPRRMQVEYV